MRKIIRKIFWYAKGGYSPKRFWNNWADTFMDDSWQVETHAQHVWILQKIKEQKPQSILEIGCGFGRNIKFLVNNGIDPKIIYGIDISERMLNRAKEYLHNRTIKLMMGNVLNLPYKDKEFDLVLIHGVLMHVKPKDIQKAISETIRVTKKVITNVEQNYNGNEYTFVHDYRNLYKKYNGVITEYIRNKKLGLDFIYVKVR